MPEKPLEWFTVDTNFHKNRKFRELRRLMNLEKRDAAGFLTLFWSVVANLAADGDITKLDLDELAHEIEWKKRWGTVDNFINMLRDAGFLDGNIVHDWQEIQFLIKERERKRDERAGQSRTVQDSPGQSRVTFDPGSNSFINIDNTLIKTLSDKYPAVDIRIELGKMEGWLMANPKNRKSNYMKFITNWLSKTQDRARRVETKTEEEKPYEYVMINGKYVKKVKE